MASDHKAVEREFDKIKKSYQTALKPLSDTSLTSGELMEVKKTVDNFGTDVKKLGQECKTNMEEIHKQQKVNATLIAKKELAMLSSKTSAEDKKNIPQEIKALRASTSELVSQMEGFKSIKASCDTFTTNSAKKANEIQNRVEQHYGHTARKSR